jgi:hypothetical protein
MRRAIKRRTISFMLCLSLPAAAALPLAGCKGHAKTEAQMEKPIVPAAAPAPQRSATPVPKLPPPTRFEVEAALHRVFGDDLIAESGPGQTFIVGDFNGDQSEDLAVIARPAPAKLDDLNHELANWTVQDADSFFVPKGDKRVVMPPEMRRPKVEKGEQVLAIIHGFGAGGWRSSDARQAYIVKHAAANFQGTAPSISQKAIRAMKLPVETEIIKEIRNNKKGFLFWTGGAYAWHPEQG